MFNGSKSGDDKTILHISSLDRQQNGVIFPSTCQSENGNFLVTLSLCRSIAFSVEICAGYIDLLKGLTNTDC